MLSEQAEPSSVSVIQEGISRTKVTVLGHSQATKQLPVPSPTQVTSSEPLHPHSRAMPELSSLEEPPESHEATAGRCHLPLSSPHHRPSTKVSCTEDTKKVPAVTATQTWAGSLQPHGATQGRNTQDPSEHRAHVHDSAATPVLQTLQPRDLSIPEGHVAPAHPLPLPAAPALPLLSPEGARSICHTPILSLSRKQEPEGESSGTAERRKICPSALVKAQQVSVPEP